MFPPRKSSPQDALMTPRRQRDLARSAAPVPDPTAPPAPDANTDSDDLVCPNCGTPLTLKAVAAPKAAPAGPPPVDASGDGNPF